MGEKYTIQKKLIDQKIKKIKVYGDILFVFTDKSMLAYKIKSGQKTNDIEGHTDSILKIIALEPQRMERKTNMKIPDDPKIVTCSLDNTIRLWDSIKIDVINVLESPEHSELSCMTFLMNCCLVATGHEDGALRLWNLDISSSVLLKSQKGGSHSNSISCVIGEIYKD
jgi:WD40 repeat protein